MLAPPFNFMAEGGGFRELVSFIKQDFVELQGSILIRESLLQTDRALVEKFVRGTLKGLTYAREQRSGTVPILARNLKVDEGLAAKIYDAVRPAMIQDGSLNEEAQRKALEHVLRRMDMKEPPDLNRIFDFSLARKVRAELEVKGWKARP
jgi:ABC-type nitrate/sulfonate/bicarbonate transport system substrate-binding protein